jgi:hypothetical protein
VLSSVDRDIFIASIASFLLDVEPHIAISG